MHMLRVSLQAPSAEDNLETRRLVYFCGWRGTGGFDRSRQELPNEWLVTINRRRQRRERGLYSIPIRARTRSISADRMSLRTHFRFYAERLCGWKLVKGEVGLEIRSTISFIIFRNHRD